MNIMTQKNSTEQKQTTPTNFASQLHLAMKQCRNLANTAPEIDARLHKD